MADQILPGPESFPRWRRVRDPAGTRALGADLARVARAGDALLLFGELGAGKTCLVQGLCAELAVAEEVISPSFTLVNRYQGRLAVAHLDFYRLEPQHDLQDIGVHEILDELDDLRMLLVAEWPHLLQPLLRRRVELLARPGAAPTERLWYARGVPDLPARYAALFPEVAARC